MFSLDVASGTAGRKQPLLLFLHNVIKWKKSSCGIPRATPVAASRKNHTVLSRDIK